MMRRTLAVAGLVWTLAFVRADGSTGASFERYSLILARMPFGTEPPPVTATNASGPVAPENSFVKTIKMTAITRNELTDSLCVGLLETQSKKNYFLNVGDQEDGIELLKAEYDAERALLRKNGDEQWVTMNDVAVTGAGAVQAGVSARAPFQTRQPISSRRSVPLSLGITKEEYERQKANRPQPISPARFEALRQNPEHGRLSAEEMEQRLRKYNMELIRAKGENGVPLPIPLTPEEDAQLVKEGVLPE